MKSFDFEAVYWEGDVRCVECLPAHVDPETDDDVVPLFADSEVQSAPVCAACGAVHDYMTVLDDGEIS